MTRRSSAALTTRSRVITPVAMLILSPLLTTAPALDAHGLTAKVDYPSPGGEALDVVGETREGALCRGASSRGDEDRPPRTIGRDKLRAAARRFDRAFLPDAVLARLRHHEDGDQEHDGRHHDGIDQRIADAVRPEVHRGGDDRDEAAAPSVADVVRDRHRRVADARREELSEKRPGRADGHA